MPSYVEVENLDNGRKLVVRINDRGPFVQGRIIDLSRRSAQLLGIDKAGTARVRVRRIEPDRETLARLAAPPVVALAPPPVTIERASATAPPTAQNYIQVAALSDAGRIAWLSGYLVAFGPVVTERAPSGATRVRIGPYADAQDANRVLAKVRDAGYSDARLVTVAPGPPP